MQLITARAVTGSAARKSDVTGSRGHREVTDLYTFFRLSHTHLYSPQLVAHVENNTKSPNDARLAG